MSIKPRPWIVAVALTAAGALAASCAQAQTASTSDLANQLELRYSLTRMVTGNDGVSSVSKEGVVLVIQKQGILGVPPLNPTVGQATYKDGVLHAPGFSTVLLGNDTRSFPVGEKAYVTAIHVNPKRDSVIFTIVECDSCNGVQQPSSYKAQVVFQFPKGYLASAAADQVEDVIDQVLPIDNPPPPPPEDPPSPRPSAPNFTNDDIINLVQAKLPDSVILSKIKSSTPGFDTSADALIKLKRAGVSDAVLQAMVEAPPSPADSAETPAPSNKQPSGPPPCDPYDACIKTAQALLDSSQPAQALPRFQWASQLDSSKGEPWAGLGNAYFQTANYDQAIQMWDNALQRGFTLTSPVCHAKALCGDKGTFFLSTKEVSFVSAKGERELTAPPSAVTSQASVQVSGSRTAYYLQLRFADKNYRFYYLPVAVRCSMGFVCPEPGSTQQKIFDDYVHDTLVKLAAGAFSPQPPKP